MCLKAAGRICLEMALIVIMTLLKWKMIQKITFSNEIKTLWFFDCNLYRLIFYPMMHNDEGWQRRRRWKSRANFFLIPLIFFPLFIIATKHIKQPFVVLFSTFLLPTPIPFKIKQRLNNVKLCNFIILNFHPTFPYLMVFVLKASSSSFSRFCFVV